MQQRSQTGGSCLNKVFAVGIGPGGPDQMTVKAYRTLSESDIIAGYTVYADLVQNSFPEKEFITTPMRREEERCRLALEKAKEGKTVSMICSGDAGVYGMAGLLFELSEDYPSVEIEVIAGVTAASSGAALLGAPLMHDFAVISLSDAMTPWQTIEKRLRAAASTGLIICLYNPESRKRSGYLRKACQIIMEYTGPDVVCGIARQISREGEECRIMTLAELTETQADMFSTVFIGNDTTRILNGKMVTPRGYSIEGSL